MFGTSGIRGPIGETVTSTLATNLGGALAAWGAEHVIVGRDPRPSGRYLQDALHGGLREAGVDVTDVGMAATPTIARTVGWRDADAGVAITASHNPPEDNGFKLWLPSGQAFRESDRETITAALEGEITGGSPAWDAIGDRTRWDGAIERHVQALVGAVEPIDDLRIVLDIGNGAGQITADALEALSANVITLNAQPDGGFPGRPSEPTAANCADLRRIVPAIDADLGIAHDGDADRMRAVDENGDFLTGDLLLAILAMATADPGDRVIAPVDTSLAVEDALATKDVELSRTRVGDVFVAEEIQASGATFGGEPSGAWIWPEETLCPDGPLAACKLAALVSRRGALSTLVEEVDRYPIRRDSIRVGEKASTMEVVRDRLQASGYDVETIDGARVRTEEGWFLIRPSGTEPVVRVTAEARESSRADALLAEATDLVETAAATG